MKFNAPIDHPQSEKIIAATAEIEGKRLEQGWIGLMFGSEKNKQGNIAGFSVVVASIFLVLFIVLVGVILIAGHDRASFSLKDQVLLVATFMTTTLGFLFGRTARARSLNADSRRGFLGSVFLILSPL